MADHFEEFRTSFFDECDEHLEKLTENLGLLATTGGTDETIHTVFRAVHSIKGGAAAFGMDALVTFCHDFETALEPFRSTGEAMNPDQVSVFIRAADTLSNIKGHAQNGDNTFEDRWVGSLEALKSIAAQTSKTELSESSMNAPDPSGHITPSPAVAAENRNPDRTAVLFRPKAEFFEFLHEPVRLFRRLIDEHSAQVLARLDTLPDWNAFSPTQPIAEWTIKLPSSDAEDIVQDVLEFCDDYVDLAPLPENPVAAAPTPKASPQANEEKTPTQTTGTKPPTTIRVDLEKIDRLVNLIGELVINNSVLTELIQDKDMSQDQDLLTGLEHFQQLTRDIQESVMTVRSQPIKSLFLRLARSARETAQDLEKPINFSFSGEQTDLDANTVSRLTDPLIHLIRNAVDHGIESAEDRRNAGKDPTGSIQIRAAHVSGRVNISITDDGSGIDHDRILGIARKRGLVGDTEVLTNAQIRQLIFRPGFSTSAEVSDISGRGVGLNIVEQEILELGGQIDIQTSNAGTTFSISLPLTLAVLEGMVVKTEDNIIVLPLESISETLTISNDRVKRLDKGNDAILLRQEVIPIVRAAEILGYDVGPSDLGDQVALIITNTDGNRIAVTVDEIIDQRQVVVKPLTKDLNCMPYISSATIMGDGKIALILDPSAIRSMNDPRETAIRRPSLDHRSKDLAYAT